MVEYFNCKKLKQCATKKIRISSDIVGCVGLRLPLGYIISENLLNALKPASYTVLEDLFIDICHSWSTTLYHITSEGIGHWQGLSAAPGASCLNMLTWNQDIASAMLLLIPGQGCQPLRFSVFHYAITPIL